MKLLSLGVIAAAAALYAGDASAQEYCREYSQAVTIGGQRQSSYGVACMQPDGAWQIISGDNNTGYTPAGFGGGYGYAPAPAPVYVPVPAPVYRPSSSFHLSIGVPSYHRGDRDYYDHRRWHKPHKHHKHHAHEWDGRRGGHGGYGGRW